MIHALLAAASAAPSTSYACNFGIGGNQLFVSNFHVLSPAAKTCTDEWVAPTAANVVSAPEMEASKVCRVTFDAASKPLFFDGKEHDASPSADGEQYIGKVDTEDGRCHFATNMGIEVYTSSYKLLSNTCDYKWSAAADVKTAVVTISANKFLLCAARYPATTWQVGWVDTTTIAEKAAVAPLPASARRFLTDAEASPSPAPRPKRHIGLRMRSAADIESFTPDVRITLQNNFAVKADVPFENVDVDVNAGSVIIDVSIYASTGTDAALAAIESRILNATALNASDPGSVFAGIAPLEAYPPNVESLGIVADPSDGSGLSAGAILGIILLGIIGVLLGVGLLIGGVLMLSSKGSSEPRRGSKQLGMHNEMHKSNEAL